jgi:Fe2+/Zn2+ uptake regulation proteins
MSAGLKKKLGSINCDFQQSREKVKKLFHDHRLKLTPQRLAVLSALQESPKHFSITEIHKKVKQILPGTGLATVYRSLETLIYLDLVKKVHLRDGCHSYVVTSKGHQHQVVCVDCNRVMEFEGCPIEDISKKLSRKTGFTIENHFLQLFGKCRECQSGVAVDT